MLGTTLFKLKKACSSLSLAPRVLRADARYQPGKFQKLSITVLRKAEKSTDSSKDKNEEYEKCKRLIELIFGPPETIQKGFQITELHDADLHHSNEMHKNKLPEMAVPHIQENAQCEKHDVVYREPYGKEDDNKGLLGIPSNAPLNDIQLHATTAKQTEEELAQKVEIISETPLVEAEIPVVDGFNVPPRVLGGAADALSFQNFESRKFDDYEDIEVKSTNITDAETFEKEYNMKATVESLVLSLEESFKLEDIRRLEEMQRIEQMLAKEIERSDFKLPIYHYASDQRSRKSGASTESDHTYDELAKRCLDAPNHKIDERLLKEMEKLGVPQTSPRGESSVIEENIIQIDVLKKPRRPVKKTEMDLETREFERDRPIAYPDKLHPAFQMANSPKPISESDPDNITLTRERIQLCELDKKPLRYSEESAADSEQVDMDAHAASNKFETRLNYNTNRPVIDTYDKETTAYDNGGEKYEPYPKYSYHQKQKSEQESFAETEIEYDEVNNRTAAKFLAAHQALHNTNKSKHTPESHKNQPTEEYEPYIAFESHSLENANKTWQYSERTEPISKTASPEEHTTSTEHETKATENKESVHYFTQHETTTSQESNSPKTNKNLECNTQSEHSATSKPKHPKETLQFITHPQPTPILETNTIKDKRENLTFDIPEPAIPSETSAEKLSNEAFQYSTPPEPVNSPKSSSVELADVTYMEPSASEKMEEGVEKNNPNISTEQISHSFVQPHTMVNPLVDSKTLAEPSDAIQKTLSAACSSLPELKLSEDVSLSEMLKRVRMRNRMEYCQAFERQMDPLIGKCGKKTPACPPPAPKCPPTPPPCPKPCKPACPPACPPPSTDKKNPCKKFKKHFPFINLESIMTFLLHQPEFDIQKTTSLPSLCGSIIERSRAVWIKKMSLKMQEIGINTMLAYPYKASANISTNFDAANLKLAKDYEPWVPIPSWPIPKKEKKRPFVCPKDGCKVIPPPKLRPDCNENPCLNFPKRNNSFSITNLLTFSVGDYVLFDI